MIGMNVNRASQSSKRKKINICIYLRQWVDKTRSFCHGQTACLPPSTGTLTPVINEALSDARKAMVLATSSTCPGRPNGCVVLDFTRNC